MPLVRCRPDDPNRCQGNYRATGEQCPYLSVVAGKCQLHAPIKIHKAVLNAYRFSQYEERIKDFASHDELKNLRMEIGVLRMTLEQIINQCGSDVMHLLAHSGKIGDMIMKIKVLVTTCHRLDIQLGRTLDQEQVMLIAHKMIEIIAEFITEPDKIEKIGELLTDEIMRISVEGMNS